MFEKSGWDFDSVEIKQQLSSQSEDDLMLKKPPHEELEQRVKELEKNF